MIEVTEEVETKRNQDKKKVDIELALKEFGLELKRIRENKNLTQVRLHELSGVDKTVISELERGLYTPSLNMIREVSDGLEISPHILIAAYYGLPLPDFNLRDKETLDKFIALANDYLKTKPLPTTSPIPQRRFKENPITDAGIETGMKSHRARSTARKKASQKEKSTPKEPETGK